MQYLAGGIIGAQPVVILKNHAHPGTLKRTRRGRPRVTAAAFAGREMLCRTVDGVDVIVAIVKEIPHLFPRGGHRAGVFTPQGFVQRGQPFMHLSVALMQREKGMCQPRRVGGGEAQIGHRGCLSGENRIGQRLAQIADQPLPIAAGKLGHIQPELRRQSEHDIGTDGPVGFP